MNQTLTFPGGRRSEVVTTSPGRSTNIIYASALMVGITLALFFVPAVNGFIGGLVGGYKVGSIKRALTAALLPAVLAAVALWAIIALFNAPVLGFFAGTAATILIVLSEVGLFVGAAVGGAFSYKQVSR